MTDLNAHISFYLTYMLDFTEILDGLASVTNIIGIDVDLDHLATVHDS